MNKVLTALYKISAAPAKEPAIAPAHQLKQSLPDGSPLQILANNRIKLSNHPGELSNYIWRPDARNKTVMAHTERLVQQNRAKGHGVPYSEGEFYSVPVHKAGFPVYDKLPARLGSDGAGDTYTVVKKQPYEPGGRASAPDIIRGIYKPGWLSYRNNLATLLHESNHNYTVNGGYGTQPIQSRINQYFLHGDPGHATANAVDDVKSAVATGRAVKDRNKVGLYNSALRAGRADFPGYPVEHMPNSYYNSLPEFLTAARSTRERLAATRGIPTVGLHANLSHDLMPNGTLPFNFAGVKAGLWSENPKYRAIPGKRRAAIAANNAASPDWFTAISNATGIPDFRRGTRLDAAAKARDTLTNAVSDEAKNGYQTRYIPNKKADLTADIVKNKTTMELGVITKNNYESQELLKHLNFMQYLIDLGPRRTAKQTELLQQLQRRVPSLFDWANNNKSAPYSSVSAATKTVIG